MRPAAIALGLALLTLPAGAAAEVPAAERSALIEEIADLLRDRYVEPEVGARAAASLVELDSTGALDAHATHADLAGALTRHLRAIDAHFLVDWRPAAADPAADHHSEAGAAAWRLRSRLENHGFRRVEVLPGNVGYLDLRFFDETGHGAAEAAAATMGLLARSDALIFDLRRNGGGEPEMVRLLISYFLPAGTHYNSLYWREPERTDELRSLPAVAGGRRLDVPLLVLISARTGSAAEAFTYSLQALGRARIVGRASAGAANPGRSFALAGGYSIFVSTGKAINPTTSESWERRGVRPDLEVVDGDALRVAYRAALADLLERAEEPVERRAVRWALEDVDYLSGSYEVEPEALAGYAGSYGDRRIVLENGRLTYRRAQRAARPMVPVARDLFLLDGIDGFRLRFERDAAGRIVRLVDSWSDGHEEANVRLPADG